MSATPIPRTLEMAVTGIREMSVIATPPEERHPVLTFAGAYDEKQVRAAIRRATLAGAGVPVLAGAAFKDKGIETLLDAVVDYLPSPLDRPAVTAESESGEVVLPPDPPLVQLELVSGPGLAPCCPCFDGGA